MRANIDFLLNAEAMAVPGGTNGIELNAVESDCSGGKFVGSVQQVAAGFCGHTRQFCRYFSFRDQVAFFVADFSSSRER